MSTGRQTFSLGERLYRISLRAYPADFRDDWGDEMLATLEARLLELRAVFGPFRMARFWAAELAAVVRTAARLRLQDERGRANAAASKDRAGAAASGGEPPGRAGKGRGGSRRWHVTSGGHSAGW